MFRVAIATLCALSLGMAHFTHAKEVNISGSTSVARVMDVLAEEFNSANPDGFIAVQGIGSSAGITMVKKGVSELGMSSRYLTERELDDSLTVLAIAFDGLAVVVNRSNPISNLSREQLYKIYKGQITNWKQVGGNDQVIAVVTREASSGTRYSFESLLGLTKVIKDRLVSDINPNNLVVNSNSMVKTLVNHNPHAVGFISVGSVDQSIKAIQFEGIAPSAGNIANKSYQLSRPFLMLYKHEEITAEATSFIQFVRSQAGQRIVSEYGYIPVLHK